MVDTNYLRESGASTKLLVKYSANSDQYFRWEELKKKNRTKRTTVEQ